MFYFISKKHTHPRGISRLLRRSSPTKRNSKNSGWLLLQIKSISAYQARVRWLEILVLLPASRICSGILFNFVPVKLIPFVASVGETCSNAKFCSKARTLINLHFRKLCVLLLRFCFFKELIYNVNVVIPVSLFWKQFITSL